MFDVDYYVKDDGTCPVEKFIDSLDTKMRAKCFWLISLLEQNGNELREPYSKYLGNGLYELRVKQSTNITRIIYFFMLEHKIILTNGFVKKTIKTPQKEIELAKRYREDFFVRREK